MSINSVECCCTFWCLVMPLKMATESGTQRAGSHVVLLCLSCHITSLNQLTCPGFELLLVAYPCLVEDLGKQKGQSSMLYQRMCSKQSSSHVWFCQNALRDANCKDHTELRCGKRIDQKLDCCTMNSVSMIIRMISLEGLWWKAWFLLNSHWWLPL